MVFTEHCFILGGLMFSSCLCGVLLAVSKCSMNPAQWHQKD